MCVVVVVIAHKEVSEFGKEGSLGRGEKERETSMKREE